MNYCLAKSSIGFYQVSKLGTIPITLLIEHILGMQRQQYTFPLFFSLLLITIGMYFVIQQEIIVNQEGLIWALLGISTTAAAQIFFGPLKNELGLDSLQLLFHTSPWLTFGSFFMTPMFDNVDKVLNFKITGNLKHLLLISSFLAVAFNISNYALLSIVSPLTYSILGHMKTIAIIALGCYFFQNWPSTMMSFGIILAMLGVIIYGQVVQQISISPTTINSPTKPSRIRDINEDIENNITVNKL
jgi:solute carrier family 35, member E3